MLYRVFTLYPELFSSFTSTSLIARAISKDIINIKLINWRDTHGVGNHRQVDDKPFGGGTGMVLQCEPIFKALLDNEALGAFTGKIKDICPNNSKFYELNKLKKIDKVTISLSPKGHVINQDTLNWLTQFKEINILCGRFEGFDERVNTIVDLELSLGDFVLNGGEVASMALIEGVSRLLPNFVTKSNSVEHDSFSLSNNVYLEHQQYSKVENIITVDNQSNLFDDNKWLAKINQYEHPIYTRPVQWQGLVVPDVLINGDHKKIQEWKLNWYKMNNK
jgi:tRNA (guanine37-N1)-methyltransferase